MPVAKYIFYQYSVALFIRLVILCKRAI